MIIAEKLAVVTNGFCYQHTVIDMTDVCSHTYCCAL